MDIRIAFAGLAHNHGMSFLRGSLKIPGVSVVGVYDDNDRNRAEKAAAELGCKAYDDLDELFTESGANTLLTADINAKRPEKIIRALDAGLDVITDKPMATTLEDLNEIQEAVIRNPERRLFLLLTERYSPLVNTAKTIIDSGEIGTIVSMILMRPHRLSVETRPAWMFDSRLYGGIINDIGVHDIDLCRWFTGCEVDDVLSAFTANRRNGRYTDFEDCGQVMMKMKDGSAAYVHVNWLTPDAFPAHGETRFIITGTKGQIEIDMASGRITMYSDKKKPRQVHPKPCEFGCAMDAYTSFSDRARKPLITSMDGVNATRAALVAQQVAWERL